MTDELDADDDVLPQYPLNCADYNRGDFVPNEVWATHAELRDPDRLRIRQLVIKDALESHFADLRQDEVAVKVSKRGLQILTHQQQFEYTEIRRGVAWRHFSKMCRKDRGIDPAQLESDNNRATLRARIVRDSRILQQVLESQKRKFRFPRLKTAD